jgi:hypothetical protein
MEGIDPILTSFQRCYRSRHIHFEVFGDTDCLKHGRPPRFVATVRGTVIDAFVRRDWCDA